jgi:hypothetical protein
MTKTFLVQPDGSVFASKEEQETGTHGPSWSEMEATMGDPNASPEKVLDLILMGMVNCLREMKRCGSDPFQAEKFKRYALEAQVLHRLEKGYIKQVLLDKSDRLNFDGPKFQFAYNYIVELIEQAIQEGLGKNSAALAQRIIDNFHKRIEKNEPHLRRRVQEIGSITGTKAP